MLFLKKKKTIFDETWNSLFEKISSGKIDLVPGYDGHTILVDTQRNIKVENAHCGQKTKIPHNVELFVEKIVKNATQDFFPAIFYHTSPGVSHEFRHTKTHLIVQKVWKTFAESLRDPADTFEVLENVALSTYDRDLMIDSMKSSINNHKSLKLNQKVSTSLKNLIKEKGTLRNLGEKTLMDLCSLRASSLKIEYDPLVGASSGLRNSMQERQSARSVVERFEKCLKTQMSDLYSPLMKTIIQDANSTHPHFIRDKVAEASARNCRTLQLINNRNSSKSARESICSQFLIDVQEKRVIRTLHHSIGIIGRQTGFVANLSILRCLWDSFYDLEGITP